MEILFAKETLNELKLTKNKQIVDEVPAVIHTRIIPFAPINDIIKYKHIHPLESTSQFHENVITIDHQR